MNGNTARGGAFAFRLEALLKLLDVTSLLDTKTTGLHYIVEIMMKHYPDDVNPAADLSAVGNAAR